ncbi:MAG: ABC transporter permease [Atopobiaceae bacterium]|nr:ABC transporter permease [Atopobiaceae bacterium]
MDPSGNFDVTSMAEGELGLSSPSVVYEEPASVWHRLARNHKISIVSIVVILLFVLGAIFAPLLTPYEYDAVSLSERLMPPSPTHLFGTDEVGRDVLTRMLYGSRMSLIIGIVPTMLSMAIGTLIGMTAGYFGGKVDTIIMRVADIVMSFPSMLLAMVVMYTLGGGTFNVFLTMAFVGWAGVARVVRSETLKLKESEYVEAARIMGVRRFRIIARHILPNCLPTIIVLFTLDIPAAILTESSLSFLGMGVQPPSASWGLMVNAGRAFLYHAPWLCFAPCLAIMVIVLAFNYLGDGLRDVLDPHLQSQ